MVVGVVKSSGVPFTALNSPVGINVSSVGVYSSAAKNKFMTENVAGTGTGQIEIAVIGEIDRGRLVGGGFVIDLQFILVGQRVGDEAEGCRDSLPRRPGCCR